MNSAIKQYREAIKAEGQVATPHHLVQMLMQNVLERLASAKGSMSRNEIAPANENIVKAMSVIAALRSSLDMDNGGEISANLNLLYGYMGTKLLEAVQKQVAKLDFVKREGLALGIRKDRQY